jgi:hypothetical protein
MAKAKGGLAILIAGKPSGKKADDYAEEDVPTEDTVDEAAPDEFAPPLDEELPPEEMPPEEGGYAEADYPEFEIPEGVDVSDMEEGDEKEVLATIRKKEGTTACITKIEGVDIAGGGEAEAPPFAEAPPGESMPPPAAGPPTDIRSRAMNAGLM